MKIASASYPITAHTDFEAWKTHTENWVKKAIASDAELLLFPEYGSMELVSFFEEEIQKDIHKQIKELEKYHSAFCETYSELAEKYRTIIVAPSFPVLENGVIFNRVYVFSEKGQVGFQDKFFMTRFENEEWGISAASPKQLTVFQAEWGSFGIQTCYDVEFSIGSFMLCQAGAELILVPSCTETIRGATRVHIGARARAMENQCYVAVAQTVGNALWSPAVDVNYGFAAFYATPDNDLPEEGIFKQSSPQEEGWLVQDLDFSLLKNVRNDGQVLNFEDHKRLDKNKEFCGSPTGLVVL